jgi:hypothetical protein
VFDIGAPLHDKKNTNWIILEVFQEFQIQIYEENNAGLKMLFKKYAKMAVTTICFVNSIFSSLYSVEIAM